MQIVTTEKIERKLVSTFISEDGIEFDKENDCRYHEQKIKMARLAGIMKCDSLTGYANFNGKECYEDSSYTWYKPRNKEELELLRDAYGSIDISVFTAFHDDYIGKWICIEQRDECVWLSTLEDAISYAQWILSEILKVDPDDVARNVLETER